jgi:hypothetical protein
MQFFPAIVNILTRSHCSETKRSAWPEARVSTLRNESHRLVDGPIFLALSIALALALSGCGRFPGDDSGLASGVSVRNATQLTLHFKVFTSTRPYTWTTVARPGDQSLVIPSSSLGRTSEIAENGCTVVDLVAFDENENEVARHPPPLCVDDVWVIEDPEASSSP